MDLKSICAWLLAATIVVSVNANQEPTKSPVAVREEEPKTREPSEQTERENVIAAQEPQIEIMELPVGDDEVQELLALHDEMEKEALAASVTAVPPQGAERMTRALADTAPGSGDALNDEDINRLMKIIPLPSSSEKESTTAETDTAKVDSKDDSTIEEQEELSTSVQRTSRALRPRGYYILAFAPIDGPLQSTYTKLDIIPAERALDGDLAVRRATKQRHHNGDLIMSGSEDDGEARLISKKKFNRYIRRLMKQIRKGTRKFQRKTRFKSKSNTPEPTVENFLHKLYLQRGAQKKKKSSWFSW